MNLSHSGRKIAMRPMTRVLSETQYITPIGSPTLDELLKDCDSFRKGDSGDGAKSDDPAHLIIDVEALHVKPVPFVLAFNNLEYDVTLRRRRFDFSRKSSEVKTLLDDVSGEACDGDILAVLGASGAGKSTLIDALAGRVAEGSLRGSVTLNGEKVLQSRLLKIISAYVMQDDLLFPMLTVKETLMFASEFRLPRTLSKSKKMERVEALIDQLGLKNAANTVIGDEGHRGVSGGERRRVSIGIDIIHDPIVLFLDEPTSGLDSTNAFMVVQVLKRIAQSGSIVIMSIHQPSTRIVELLDQLIILSRGKSVFNGSPASLPGFFSDFGRPIPEKENITEFALDLVRELEGSKEGRTRSLVEFNEKWQQNKLSLSQSAPQTNMVEPHRPLSLKEAINASVCRGKLVSGSSRANSISMETVSSYANPLLFETFILAKRYMKNWMRMPELVGTRIATVMVTGFLLATVYWKLDHTPRGAQERLTLFAFVVPTMFYCCLDNVPVFIQERYIFLRETTHNAYRTSSYVISHSLVSLPQLIAPSLVFSTITFWTVGLSGGLEGYFFYSLLIYASFWSGSSVVIFISGVVPNIMLSYMIAISYLAYCLLLSGFYVNRDRIPIYWTWFHYISLLKYPYEAVLINEFDDPSRCFVKGVQVFDSTLLGGVSGPGKVKLLETLGKSLKTTITESTCLRTGSDLLAQQGITQLSKWDCLWITFATGLFFRILFYFALLFGSRNKRT